MLGLSSLAIITCLTLCSIIWLLELVIQRPLNSLLRYIQYFYLITNVGSIQFYGNNRIHLYQHLRGRTYKSRSITVHKSHGYTRKKLSLNFTTHFLRYTPVVRTLNIRSAACSPGRQYNVLIKYFCVEGPISPHLASAHRHRRKRENGPSGR